MRAAPLPLLTLLTLLPACKGEEDDGFGRGINHGEDDTAGTTTLDDGEDTAWDTAQENGGGGADTWNAVWVRCEEGGLRWTFHAELNYAARRVDVESDVGTVDYEMWYLEAQDDTSMVWEVTVPDGLSANTCDETIPLVWTAVGWADWEVDYESQYTPP